MQLSAWMYTLLPALAAILGSVVALRMRPGPIALSAIQHFAAGVVFAAAASEVLPDVMHRGLPYATVLGGGAAVVLMLLVKQIEHYAKGSLGLLVAVAIDLFIDGIVLGIGFVASLKVGLLLTIALTLEVLFLGLTVVSELREASRSSATALLATACLVLLLPVGALIGAPVGQLSAPLQAAFLSFGLVALLYLVTEELLVEAHEVPDRPWVTATFFVGFLGLLVIEEFLGLNIGK